MNDLVVVVVVVVVRAALLPSRRHLLLQYLSRFGCCTLSLLLVLIKNTFCKCVFFFGVSTN